MQSLWKWMCFVILLIRTTHSAIFTVSERENILTAQLDVANEMRKLIVKEEARIDKMKRIADDFEKHSKETVVDVEGELANPVNNYLLVKRFTEDWDNLVENVIRGNNTNEFLRDITSKTCYFPGRNDLTEAALNFYRLQDTYSLSTKEVAQGNIKHITNTPLMSASDCFVLGRIAYNQNDYYHSVMWMQEALDRWESEKDTTVFKADILDYYSFATSRQGNAAHALDLTLEWLQIEPDHIRAQNNKQFYADLVKNQAEERMKGHKDVPSLEFTNVRPPDTVKLYRSTSEFYDYEAMCRGETPIKYKYAHKLTCQYRSWHPIHVINPLKEEVLYLDPFVGVYHDLLTDKQIEKVKELAKPKLHRSGVFTLKKDAPPVSLGRTSFSAWIHDNEDSEIRKISVKSAVLSNLTLESVEELQVLNYRIGGHYEPHFDFARKHDKNTFDAWRGNRIATVIYYMKDVISGGSTVFPSLGVRIAPEKGACGIWYNLHRNGDPDMRTIHASCPVLVGSKWVCNKWFHERGQEFTRLCDVNPRI